MAIKDYYAILMVHPKAETFVIEAAYKRLAREYHPDVGSDVRTAHNNHEKMIEINEAYQVLANPTRRRQYDVEYERQARSNQLFVSVANATSSSSPVQSQRTTQKADSVWGNVCPAAPDPVSFGIDAGYWERALEGAQAWKLREHRIPKQVKWMTRILCGLVGITISLVFFRTQGTGMLALFAWFALPLLGELCIRLIERIRDAHLLRYKFNPLYNPNPAGYNSYAEAQAQYEAETVLVYVSRDAIYHAKKTCPSLSSYEPMPIWFARLRKAHACPQCGRFLRVAPKRLPPPFGKGDVPHNAT